MSSERIDIVVTKSGAKEAAAEIDKIGQDSERSGQKVDAFNGILRTMKATLASLGIGLAVREIQQQVDAYTSIINRLKLVSSSQADLIKTEQALFDISQRTRGSFEATATLYNKLALQAGNLGIEAKSLLPVLETINQTIALGGSTSEEARAGLMQFSQALASNRFQGDELRSVLENLPVLAQTIAKGLGTTTAGLRKMGAAGELTAKKLLEAISSQSAEISRQFASLTPTLSQSFQVLQNAFLRFIGQADQANGVSRTLAQGILFVADNINVLVGALELAGIAFVALKAQAFLAPVFQSFVAGVTSTNIALQTYMANAAAAGIETTVFSRTMAAATVPITAVRGAVASLWALLTANPLGVIVTAISAVVLFGDKIKLTSDGSITLLGALIGIWNTLKDVIGAVVNALSPLVGPIWNAIRAVAVGMLDALIAGFNAVSDALGGLFGHIGDTNSILGTLVQNMKDATAAQNETGLAAADLGNAFGGDGGGPGGAPSVATGAKKASRSTKDLIDNLLQMGRIDPKLQWEAMGRAIDDWAKDQERAMKRAQKNMDDYTSYVQKAEDETNRLALTSRNAFGDMIASSDEWARRTGANFNSVAGAAASASSSISSASGGGGGGGFSSGGSTNSGSSFSSDFANGGSNNVNFNGGAGSAITTLGYTARAPQTGTGLSFGYGKPPNIYVDYLREGGAAFARDYMGMNPQAQLINSLLGTRLTDIEKASGIQQILDDKALFPDGPGQYAKYGRSAYPEGSLGYGHTNPIFQSPIGFRNGGDFQIGGSGGPDSQLVQFMASPGENVTVETPTQRRRRLASERGEEPRGKNITVNMTVQTPDANSFRRSQTQTLLQLRRKLNGVAG